MVGDHPVDSRAASGAIVRAELLDWLDEAGPLTLVQGATGTGKSMLLDAWRRRMTDRGVGVSVTDVHDLASDAAVLIVDAIDHPLADSVVSTLLDQVARGTRVVVAGRAAASIERAAQLRRIEVSIRFTPDLHLSPAEVAEFARAAGYPHDDAAVKELLEDTGGWVEVLDRLLSRSHPGLLDRESARRWIANVVLDDLDPGLRRAAVRLSVLSKVHPRLARMALGEEGSATTLARLIESGILYPTSPGGSEAVIPALVRGALRGHAGDDDPLVTAGHVDLARAALASDPIGYEVEVVEHASRGGAWEILQAFWEMHGPESLRRHPAQVRAAFARVPDHVIRSSPTLAFARALSSMDATGDVSLAQLVSVPFDEPLSIDDARDSGRADRFVEAVVLRMLRLRLAGRPDLADDLANRATAELARQGERGENGASPLHSALLLVHHTLARMLVQNERGTTAELAMRGLEYARQSEAEPFASTVAGYLAVLRSAAGWNVTAAALVDDLARNVSPVERAVHSTPGADLAAAMLAIDALDGETARLALDRADQQSQSQDLWPFLVLAWGRYSLFFETQDEMDDRFRRVLWSQRSTHAWPGAGRMVLDAFAVLADVRAGRVADAVRRIRAAPDDSDWMASLRARVHLSAGEHLQALQTVQRAIADDGLGNRERAQLLFVGAASAFALHRRDVAADLATRAVALAQIHGLTSTYLIVSHAQRRALLELCGVDLPPELVERLQRMPDVYRDVTGVRLSPRESDVLNELRRRGNHREIAEALYISVATTRSHLRAIYLKLGVNDRESAIVRAAELGLLVG